MSLSWITAALLSASCPDGGLAAERVIELPAETGGVYGTLQYEDTLPLGPREIVLTFDDGPHLTHTETILDTLDAHCITAIFFVVGVWAEARPEEVREIWRRGHLVANHTHGHPNLHRRSVASARREVDRGFAAIDAALAGLEDEDGNPARAARIFRFPGLNDHPGLRAALIADGITIMSTDIGTDDWRRINSWQVRYRARRNITARGSGIVLMHDTKARTALALPHLLQDLAEQDYRVVTVREATGTSPSP
jgi:peptidoglycan/xylan/chitin deacetylase (PgdA/CDA1 family)